MIDPWDEYLAALDPARRDQVLTWFEGRPPDIQRLARRYPPGALTVGIAPGRTPAYVISYASTSGAPGLFLSYIDPAVDYGGALAGRFFVCGEHLRTACGGPGGGGGTATMGGPGG
jgi:hypothetical protein